MLELRGFSAWITSDGEELVEFEPRTNEKNHTATCWIAGPIGKTFTVHWRDHGSQVDSASYIYVDGFKVSGQFLYGRGEEQRRGVRVGPTEERPFVFSEIKADDSLGSGGQKAGKNVGSIILEIKQVKRTEVFTPRKVLDPPSVIRGHRHEGDVCVRYGDARPMEPRQSTWKIQPYDPNEPGPFVTFTFRYRTRDWLVDQGIIDSDVDITREAPEPWPLSENLPHHLATVADTPDQPQPKSEQESELERGQEVEPGPENSPSPFTSYPGTPLTPRDSLGLLGMRPGTSRNVSNSSIRSFSGAWDPSSSSGNYEEITWDEYRPEDHNADRRELDDYYS